MKQTQVRESTAYRIVCLVLGVAIILAWCGLAIYSFDQYANSTPEERESTVDLNAFTGAIVFGAVFGPLVLGIWLLRQASGAEGEWF